MNHSSDHPYRKETKRKGKEEKTKNQEQSQQSPGTHKINLSIATVRASGL